MATINGSAGNDTTSTGGSGSDVFNAYGGDDSINAGAGNDTVYGGDGNDRLDGDAGNDSLSGGTGNDMLRGGAGSDSLDGGLGNDTLYGDAGDDTGYGGGGADALGGSNADGAGNDTFYGGDGNDTLTGGSGNDTLSGNADSDTLYGGTGNDVLTGGAGHDTLTGGVGQDSFVLDSAGGADIITDFSLTDSVGNGHGGDQIDVSDLTNGAGGPVTAWDVVVTDDGFGNAKLTFPEGETLILQGISPAQMATAGQRYAAGIPCFTAGTMIRTPQGEVAVEGLRAGDLVTTLDHGPQPVLWAAARHLSATTLAQMPHLRPVRLTKSCTGTERDLLVSPQHAVLLRHPQAQSLVRAAHLARCGTAGARIARGLRQVSYVHLMFIRHEIIFANDTLSESFYPGPWGLAMLDPAALRAIAQRFPALASLGAARAYGPTARPVLRYAEVLRMQAGPALCRA